MAQALYRTYRPQGWEEVVGQEHIVRTLRNALQADRIAHAYLFAGPRGTGKTTLARLLAKAVNCLNAEPRARPCNACENCRAVNEGRFMDLIEIDAASNTSVEDVRELRDKINFAPSQGKYKVYIIDEVHMLSTRSVQCPAQNPGGAAAPCDLRPGDHRNPQNPGHGALPLSAS
jgi:DNA polymerase-3 subunit gamma/tau